MGREASALSDTIDAFEPVARPLSAGGPGKVCSKEIANSQDHLDRWSTRAAGGTERAEREFGLSDEEIEDSRI
jgi:hypothetical protein